MKKNNVVLILGGGGREHALTHAIVQSESVERVFVAPGNPGTSLELKTRNLSFDVTDPQAVVQQAKDLEVDLVVVGPEKPLMFGVADALQAAGILVFGPTKEAAQMEGSKIFSAQFLEEFSIPHPKSVVFTDFAKAVTYIQQNSTGFEGGIVVKADGLADGKGVTVCDTAEEALSALSESMENLKFGDAGKRVVLQEKLVGFEASVHVMIDGNEYVVLPTAEDHKQISDGDKGLMTGGMGVVSPHGMMTDQLFAQIEHDIIQPTVEGIKKRKMNYKGMLFIGLMVTAKGPQVLEYNVRFGDPETQAMLSVLEQSTLFDLIYSVAAGKIDNNAVKRTAPHSIVVTLASEGYPVKPEIGKEIFGLRGSLPEGVFVFHAGTKLDPVGKLISAGGRVLSVVGTGETAQQAYDRVYRAIGEQGIHFEGMQFRKDIGKRQR